MTRTVITFCIVTLTVEVTIYFLKRKIKKKRIPYYILQKKFKKKENPFRNYLKMCKV